jgi:hypothetical protein
MGSFQGAAVIVRKGRVYSGWKRDWRLSIEPESAHGSAMAKHAPLHFFEIVFYSTASLLVAIGLALYFLR